MIEKINEKKWFGFCNNPNEIDINTLNNKTKLIFLIQLCTDNTIGIYGCIKNNGLFSLKDIYPKLNLIVTVDNHLILNDVQTLKIITDKISEYFSSITTNINFYTYQEHEYL